MTARDKQIADFLRAEEARERGEEIHEAVASAVCGRPLIGQGTTTWDQLCQRPAGHQGGCSAIAPPVVVHGAENPLCSCGHRKHTHLDGEDGLACSRCGCVRYAGR